MNGKIEHQFKYLKWATLKVNTENRIVMDVRNRCYSNWIRHDTVIRWKPWLCQHHTHTYAYRMRLSVSCGSFVKPPNLPIQIFKDEPYLYWSMLSNRKRIIFCFELLHSVCASSQRFAVDFVNGKRNHNCCRFVALHFGMKKKYRDRHQSFFLCRCVCVSLSCFLKLGISITLFDWFGISIFFFLYECHICSTIFTFSLYLFVHKL